MARLEGKRIVITGSSRSLGRHFALACAAEGASLVINGTNNVALAEVESQPPPPVTHVEARYDARLQHAASSAGRTRAAAEAGSTRPS